MKNQWLIYLIVFVLIIVLPFALVEGSVIIIFLQLFIGIIQLISSVVRYIYKLIKYKSHDKTIRRYWLIVLGYAFFMICTYYFYINHIPHFLFEMKRQVKSFVYLLALPIAVWYLFNISFLNTKRDEKQEIDL